MVPAARAASAGHRPAADRVRRRSARIEAARPGERRALRRYRRGPLAADPDRRGSVCGRSGRRLRKREYGNGFRLVADLSATVRHTPSTHALADQAADHGLDGRGVKGDRVEDAQGAGQASASPSSSTPAMAASTAAPRACTARSRRTSRWRSRSSSAQQARRNRLIRHLPDARQATSSCAWTTACASRASTMPTCSSRSMPTRSACKGIRGATVYTVSDKASDAEAAGLADRENLSDQLAGIEIKDDNHGSGRHSGRSHPPRDAHLLGALCALAGRRAVEPVGADQQSASLRGLQGAEGARRARRCWSNSAICPMPRTRRS